MHGDGQDFLGRNDGSGVYLGEEPRNVDESAGVLAVARGSELISEWIEKLEEGV